MKTKKCENWFKKDIEVTKIELYKYKERYNKESKKEEVREKMMDKTIKRKKTSRIAIANI